MSGQLNTVDWFDENVFSLSSALEAEAEFEWEQGGDFGQGGVFLGTDEQDELLGLDKQGGSLRVDQASSTDSSPGTHMLTTEAVDQVSLQDQMHQLTVNVAKLHSMSIAMQQNLQSTKNYMDKIGGWLEKLHLVLSTENAKSGGPKSDRRGSSKH